MRNSGKNSENLLLSHYRIISKIGAGGVGEVYLAEDTRLDRKVALQNSPKHSPRQPVMRRRPSWGLKPTRLEEWRQPRAIII
jgi:serine/threonine protein kinase